MQKLTILSLVFILLTCQSSVGEDAADALRNHDQIGRTHWAFQPIRNADLPSVSNSAWVRNGIDHFILRRLEQEGVKPSPVADAVTLIRRLYLDLIGLPPTPEQVEQFLAEDRVSAFDNVVTELLDSPHYGERWGRYWLDMARYADSNGYEADRPRPHAWRWRDWVIDALNRDLPFDQFTIQQLAGDLLPGATISDKIATGFHRNTLTNTEGGVDPEEDRVKRTVDRTNTSGKVWLGLTIECGQCHSHKYDPISQHEYYRLYAFFNSLSEPIIPVPNEADQRQYAADISQFKREHQLYLDAIAAYRSDAFSAWLASLSDKVSAWQIVNPERLDTNAPGVTLTLEDDLSVFATGPNDLEATYTVTSKTRLSGITGLRLEALADDRLPAKGPGLNGNGNFVLSSIRVFAKPADNVDKNNKGQYFPLTTARANFEQDNRLVTHVLGDDASSGWAIYPRPGKDHVAVFEFAEEISSNAELQITIELDHQTHHDHNLGKFRLSLTNVPRPIPANFPQSALEEVIAVATDKRSGRDVKRLVQYFGYQEPDLDALIKSAEDHLAERPQPPETTIRAQIVTESSNIRLTHVHVRGDFLSKGDKVQPDTPSVLPPLVVRGDRPDRLDLANWIVAKSNPLTARVIVNRIWQQHFGRGLVVTDDDFGTQGEPPSHPDLLDWLAVKFRDSGWSLKRLHRLIVSSATWRQSSALRSSLLERDPYNTWSARQNRLRVEAEIIRDMALASSGLLHYQVGGPSVYPPQPEELVKLGFQKSLSWPNSSGSDKYRRGIYTFFQRTVPYPMFVQFDAADSNTSCTKRDRSNTPLQALTLWNDPVLMECFQALGNRALECVPPAPKGATPISERVLFQRIDCMYRLCIAREPGQYERKILGRFFYAQFKRYRTDPEAAQNLVGSVPNRFGLAERAATVSLARVIMNSDEFITRE